MTESIAARIEVLEIRCIRYMACFGEAIGEVAREAITPKGARYFTDERSSGNAMELFQTIEILAQETLENTPGQRIAERASFVMDCNEWMMRILEERGIALAEKRPHLPSWDDLNELSKACSCLGGHYDGRRGA